MSTITKHADHFSPAAQMTVVAEIQNTISEILGDLAVLRTECEHHPEDAHRLREAVIAHLETVRPAVERLRSPVERLWLWEIDRRHAELRDAAEEIARESR